jgi:hypothetical protein
MNWLFVVSIGLLTFIGGCQEVPNVSGEWVGRVVTVSAHDTKEGNALHDVAALQVESGPVLKEAPRIEDGCTPLLTRNVDGFARVLFPDPAILGKRVKVKGTMIQAMPHLPLAASPLGDAGVARDKAPNELFEYFIVVNGDIEPLDK